LDVCEVSSAFLKMKKVVLPVVALFMCVASDSAIRAVTATTGSAVAVPPQAKSVVDPLSGNFQRRNGEKK
jgi:hypothetical protein